MYAKKKMSARQTHGKATNRGVSSIKYCQEKYCCDGENAEAGYECDECGSLQCAQCEFKLHELPRTTFHDRRRLESPPPEKLCQLPTCSRRNYADVRCDECARNLCFDCSKSVHAHGKRKQHKPQRLDSMSLGLADINLDDPPADGVCIKDASADEFAARNTRNSVNLLSQDSDDNDSLSLTYLTLPPQESCPSGTVVTAVDNQGLGELAYVTPVVAPTNMTDCGKAIRRQIDDSGVETVYKDCTSFLLADQQENLKVANEGEFIQKLGCDPNVLVKVVSIFGNTGDGKSYTLNHTFFGGKEVFTTSAEQISCTMGIWAAFDPVRNAIIIDSEGLLGVSVNQNQRTRLLLKVLAVSDIVIYRSNADRLHNDLFQFLGDASAAYSKHFSQELRAAVRRGNMNLRPSDLGPAVVIFHETRHTDTLGKNMGGDSPEGFLRQRFQELGLSIDAFSSMEYIGTQTTAPSTDFSGLLNAVTKQLLNTNVRSKRKPAVVFSALQVLNKKFNGKIEQLVPSTFPDQYFTCTASCLACGGRCKQTVNHEEDDIPHSVESQCQYKHSLDNKVYTCRACYNRGQLTVVVPKAAAASDNTIFGLAKYAWSGYVLECPQCGIIYRSRQYWYGNQDPDKAAIRTEVRHVWPGANPTLQGTHNAARRLLDGIQYVSDNIASMSAKPAAAVSHWVTDQIAPPYWVPNNQITHCRKCETEFDVTIPIHHCRACGEGFCDECSLKRRKVPERGWGNELVRVCDDCYESSRDMRGSQDPKEVTARRVGEVFSFTVGSVASVVTYPIVKTVPDLLLDSTRPTYWVPDDEIVMCHLCRKPFGVKLTKHHCRACGQGICGECSGHNRAVPSRGWDHPVRVCTECNRKKGEL